MTIRDDLIAARALIDTPEKWANSEDTLGCGRMCIVTATGYKDGWVEAEDTLCLALPTDFNSGDNNSIKLIAFNDHPSTTHTDIMALFDRAIASLPESAP